MFIMGGGEGSSAREALKHKSLEKVVMCDIDQVISQIHFNLFTFYCRCNCFVLWTGVFDAFMLILLQEVVDFCRTHLTVNHDAFCHKKLKLVINDAK